METKRLLKRIDSAVGVGDAAAAADFRLVVSCSFCSCDTGIEDKAARRIYLGIIKLRKRESRSA